MGRTCKLWKDLGTGRTIRFGGTTIVLIHQQHLKNTERHRVKMTVAPKMQAFSRKADTGGADYQKSCFSNRAYIEVPGEKELLAKVTDAEMIADVHRYTTELERRAAECASSPEDKSTEPDPPNSSTSSEAPTTPHE